MDYNLGFSFDIFKLINNKEWFVYTDKKEVEEIIKKLQPKVTKRRIPYCGMSYDCFCVPFNIVLFLYINRKTYKYVALRRDNKRNTYSVWTETSQIGGGTRLFNILDRCGMKGFRQL